MATFLWIALWSMLLMAGTTISISVLSKWALARNPKASPVFPISGLVCFVGCLIPAVWVAVGLEKLPELGVLAVVGMGLWLANERLIGVKREAMLLALCVIAALLIPNTLKLFTMIPVAVAYGILGCALYLMMRVFMIMDRISGLSMITLLAQGLLIVMMEHMGLLPREMLLAAFYIFVVVMSISQTIKVFSKGYAVLGTGAACLTGFVAGYVWMYLMAIGYPYVPLVLYSYDLFEIILATVMTIIATRRIYPLTVPFLLEKAMASGLRPKKLVRFMFLILVLTSLLSLLFFSEMPVLKNILIIQAIVLAGTYYILNGWSVPKPTFRDLAQDLKNGFSDLKTQIKQMPLKNQTAVKTPVVVERQEPVKQKSADRKPVQKQVRSTQKKSPKKTGKK